jgi:ankyrin repeat protein
MAYFCSPSELRKALILYKDFVNSKNSNGVTLLFVAAQTDDAELVNILIGIVFFFFFFFCFFFFFFFFFFSFLFFFMFNYIVVFLENGAKLDVVDKDGLTLTLRCSAWLTSCHSFSRHHTQLSCFYF